MTAQKKPIHEIYMHMANGKRYFPFLPRPSDVDIEVIAHHLATKGRWNGATVHPTDETRIHYSVAEHSVYVADYVAGELNRPDLELEALLHDAAEAFNGDLIRPLKYSEDFRKPFKRVERVNEIAVARRFQIIDPMPNEVKIADDAVCHTEWHQIVPRDPSQNWEVEYFPTDAAANITIAMLHPYEAKALFLKRHAEIRDRMALAA